MAEMDAYDEEDEFGQENDEDEEGEEGDQYKRTDYISGIEGWLKDRYPFWTPSKELVEQHGDLIYRYALRSEGKGQDTEETIFNSLDIMFMRMIMNEFGMGDIIKTMCETTGKDPYFFLNKMFTFASGYLEQCLLIMPME